MRARSHAQEHRTLSLDPILRDETEFGSASPLPAAAVFIAMELCFSVRGL